MIAAEIPLAFELGIKGTLFYGRLGLDANVFSTKGDGLPGPALRDPAGRGPACNPESVDVTTRGAEFGVYGQPLEGLTLNGIIYNIAEYPNGWTGSTRSICAIR